MTIRPERTSLSRPATISVLLVEDNPGDAALVQFLLDEVETTSFEIWHAERIGEALARVRERDFDVVLLDLSLPDANGLQALSGVREVAPGLPVVVLSGLDDEEVALRALGNGAQDYLVKGQGDGSLVARSIRYAIERKRAEERLAFLSQYDHLTGLVNRALFQDRLEGALARADRDGTLVAVMVMDLDRFKAVNDTFGHARGDEILRGAAERLLSCVSESDTVARMSGDEFGLLIESLSGAQEAVLVAERITKAFSEPFLVDGHEVLLTVCVGISVRPPSEADGLLKDATAAVQRAKRMGGNVYQFYTPEMNVQAFERMVFEASLRRALEREEFVLHYQPQVELVTGRIVGAEALVRWRHPDLGVVPPARFIPVLEEIGLIAPVGEWVLRTACSQAKSWHDSGFSLSKIAVNISARQFRQEDLAETVSRILLETGLEARSLELELELTESLIMEDVPASSAMLAGLKSVTGLRVSVDDFGTGYSSLAHLKRFPLDTLKIDQSFVEDVTTDTTDAAIVATIIDLAHNLNLRVIAEGVENREQISYLREKGCDEVQGFFCGPRPANEFATLIERGCPLPDGSGPDR